MMVATAAVVVVAVTTREYWVVVDCVVRQQSKSREAAADAAVRGTQLAHNHTFIVDDKQFDPLYHMMLSHTYSHLRFRLMQ